MIRFNQIRYIKLHQRMPIIYATRIFTTTNVPGETQPSLFTRLKSEVKDAMKKKDQLKLNVVRVSIPIYYI
jgi:hypothetical protein